MSEFDVEAQRPPAAPTPSADQRPPGAALPDPRAPADQRPPAELTPQPVEAKITQRPHPLTPLIRGWIVFVSLGVLIGRDFLPGRSGEGAAAIPILALALIVVLIALLAGISGFVTWFYTKYIVDDDELRIETGLLTRNSKRVPFRKIQSVDVLQPLAARLFGLAELRVEVGGTDDSGVRLRYLTRRQAADMRDYLVRRAHGEQVTIAESAAAGTAPGVFTDLSGHDSVLVRLTPARLIVGYVTTADFYLPVLLVLTAGGIATALGQPLAVLPILIPVALGFIPTMGKRLFSQFNYTLAQAGPGLRITRGLTNLTSQSVPVDRIQGVQLVQPFFWRFFGWHRVKIEVLGYGAGSDGDSGSDAASKLLLPVADADQVAIALRHVLPEVDLSAVERHRSPNRTAWLRWFDYWSLFWGYDDRVVISGHGWITRVLVIVPHAKTQSVELSQGPLQRRLRLATVAVHTTAGFLDTLEAVHLDPRDARAFAFSQLPRAEHARRTQRQLQQPPANDSNY